MIVGNNRFDAFDGVAYDRHRQTFRQVDRLEVLTRPSRITLMAESTNHPSSTPARAYDRQQRIPGWNQVGLERQRIGIIGAGGNGAPLLQILLGIGAGRRGFITIADHDLIEESNLPRIPYAVAQHVHTPKVTAAAFYAGQKSPSTPLFPFPCRFAEKPVLDRLKLATVLFYCGDNDGGRKETNDFALRYGIPLIDLGCDVQVDKDQVVAGGQVRLVLPGQNACLVCCRGFDPSEAAMDELDDVGRALQAAQGYVRGADATATASVANLNGLTVQFAVAQFLSLVNGPRFCDWDYLHFDQFTGRTIPARTNRLETCPACGTEGTLAAGDGAPGRGVVVDGVVVDGVAVDGLAVDGVAVDGVAVDGVAVDGLADVRGPQPKIRKLDQADYPTPSPSPRETLGTIIRRVVERSARVGRRLFVRSAIPSRKLAKKKDAKTGDTTSQTDCHDNPT